MTKKKSLTTVNIGSDMLIGTLTQLVTSAVNAIGAYDIDVALVGVVSTSAGHAVIAIEFYVADGTDATALTNSIHTTLADDTDGILAAYTTVLLDDADTAITASISDLELWNTF